ncbi:penicillin-binding protein [Lactococcus lactis subsp. lactis IO-1]|nr:penicillin-binding protein [Lactococcus lactis subsp. lactis IO-1]
MGANSKTARRSSRNVYHIWLARNWFFRLTPPSNSIIFSYRNLIASMSSFRFFQNIRNAF